MHLHFEQNISSRTECTIHSLSWMGKVPDTLPGDTAGGWKLNRGQYYSEGWLSSGNAKGIVGVTFTASHCRKYDPPNRSNFNLRGHRSEVILVRWNEPYQKLATCDSQGIIFVWIKHEGRWSIELINDRNSQVTDFAWSHDGRMALICYCDGFVLVGSVAGQRYWSSMLNLDNTSITCGVWSPDDQKASQNEYLWSKGLKITKVRANISLSGLDQKTFWSSPCGVMFGTTDGQIIVMSSTGAMVSQIMIHEGMEISALAWSCEKFNMEETDTDNDQDTGLKVTADSGASSPVTNKVHTLVVCFKYGALYFMNNYDDVCPRIVHSLLTGLKLDWSNCGQYLAAGGFTRLPNLQCQNEIHFYSATGELVHWISVPTQGKPLTALCWGHNDRRLFVAAGHNLHVAWVIKHAPSLQYLCQRSIQRVIKMDTNVEKLPLPTKLSMNVQALFSPTIKSYIPDPFKLREFVCTPPPGSERLFCTMIRHGEETSGGHYTLYLEYLGGLIPLLKGKRASKLRPDFVIYDPKIKPTGIRKEDLENFLLYEADIISSSTSSDSDMELDGCGGSPRVNRKKRLRNFRAEKVAHSTTFRTLNELFYNDNLPESNKLVEVMSNIWGTKFRIVGVASHLPEDIGNVLYKTSLLHLQPRQMTVTVTELPRDESVLAQDPHFTAAGNGDEEQDRLSLIDGLLSGAHNEHFTKDNTPSSLDDLHSNDGDIISVDVLTNHCELSSQGDSISDSYSTNNSICDRQKSSVCMKTKLSPASETHPQNNQAFNISEEDSSVIFDSYKQQGARPKVPLAAPTCANQALSEEPSGVIGVALNSNFVNNSKNLSSIASSAKCISSQSEISSSAQVLDAGSQVGNYFFSNGHSSQSPRDQKHIPSFVDRFIRSDLEDNTPRWADPACQGIKFVDDEDTHPKDLVYESHSVCDSSQILSPTSGSQKRLYLEGPQELEERDSSSEHDLEDQNIKSMNLRLNASHSSINSSEDDITTNGDVVRSLENITDSSETNTQCSSQTSLDKMITSLSLCRKRKSSLLNDVEHLDITQSTSLPASPLHRLHKPDSPSKKLKEEAIQGKCKHHSPLFKRKSKYVRVQEHLDHDYSSSSEEIRIPYNYKNLESFQKAQLKQKLKRVRSHSEDRPSRHCQFVMHNKAPLWNENSQVYQLDFGGRVTQESAKNFQIEFKGKQVMQFGRIDSNAYTLDFQYPFTAIQAFAVALANVTQRLK